MDLDTEEDGKGTISIEAAPGHVRLTYEIDGEAVSIVMDADAAKRHAEGIEKAVSAARSMKFGERN